MKHSRPLGAKTSAAYEYVKQRILDGTFLPGHRLILESISQATGMSQLPVREALRRLEAEGYVDYRHNAGARVTELDPDAYEATQRVIAVLEGAATAAAAPLLAEETLQRLDDLNHQMRRRREEFDAEGFMALNAEFHDLICDACPNEHLLEILAGERSRMTLIRKPTIGVVMRHSVEFLEDHDQLIRLIRNDPQSPAVQTIAQAHKLRILHAVQVEVTRPTSLPV